MIKSFIKIGLTVGMAVLAFMATLPALAGQPDAPAPAPGPEKIYTGTIISVDANEHTLRVKWWAMFDKSFNLGDACVVSQLGNSRAAVSDLRVGEKVTVGYVKVHGVLIANRIEQEAMRYEGTVKAFDAAQGTLTLAGPTFERQLQLAADCKVGLRNGRTGTFADIRTGNYVTVTYERPAGAPVVRQIDQTSIAFTGTLTAIDLSEKTVKAKTAFGSKKFNVGDDCAIVINGKTGGRLADLRLNESVDINYDEINGVKVADRIAPVAAEKPENLPANSATGSPAVTGS